jgi:hypothetical protein
VEGLGEGSGVGDEEGVGSVVGVVGDGGALLFLKEMVLVLEVGLGAGIGAVCKLISFDHPE